VSLNSEPFCLRVQLTGYTDPEWALFYAGYLQARLWDQLGRLPTRTELIYLLVAADKAFQATGQEYKEWPRFYATRFLEHFAQS
jgi:NAD(P)H-hydrate epimerase